MGSIEKNNDCPFIPQMEPWFDEKEADACNQYMRSGGYVTEFRHTRELEKMICDYTGSKHCFMVNNGTLSLSIALLAMGISVGDEVLVPDFTMIASPNSVKLIGAKPVLIDVEPNTLTINLDAVKKAYNPKVKAVIHVSLNTRSVELAELREWCDQNNVYLLEDSAQSLGSRLNGKHLGTFGHIGSFSFSSPKIISTGQGGALITDDDDLALRIKKTKDFGRGSGGCDQHDMFGINCKFTDVQAVIGIEQMKKLEWRVNRLKEIWKYYYDRLSGLKGIEMIESDNPEWLPWFVDIYLDDPDSCGPDELAAHLKSQNIGTRRVYPPIHTQSAYSEMNSLSFPVTEEWSRRGLWLPSSTKLTDEQLDRICSCVEQFLTKID